MKRAKETLAIVVAGVLAACGGGGGGGAEAPTAPAPLAWQGARFLKFGFGLAGSVDVAINGEGVGYAIWRESTSGKSVVFASRYGGSGWEPARAVSADVNGAVSLPQVVVLPDGEALAVWMRQTAAGSAGLVFKRSVNGAWPGEEQVLQDGVGDLGGQLEMSADANGTAIAVWAQRTGPVVTDNFVIHGAVFRDGVLEQQGALSAAATNSKSPDVAFDADGNALAAWTQRNSTTGADTVRVVPFVGGTWKNGHELPAIDASDSREARLMLSREGRAFVVAGKLNRAPVEVHKVDNFLDGHWIDQAIALGSPALEHGFPRVALDAAGNAIVVWLQTESAKSSLQSMRISASPDAGVFELGPVENQVEGVEDHALASHPGGHATAVWLQMDAQGGLDVLSARLDPASNRWTLAEKIEADESQSADGNETPSVAANARGQAIAAWIQETRSSLGASTSVMVNVLK